jgi:voltage-gated potassium channel
MDSPQAVSPVKPASEAPPITSVDIILMFLSLFVLGSMIAQQAMDLPEELNNLLVIFDNMICGAFLLNFIYKITTVPDRKAYMKWGWIDLLASIPNVDALRVGRAVSVLRVILILRAFRSLRMLWKVLFINPARGVMALTMMLTISALIVASILILKVETADRSNIKSAYDALWWSLTTITTVGYGDHFPVTVAGRVIAAGLMAVGITLYATFTAFISSWVMEFATKHKSEEDPVDLLHEEIRLLRVELNDLRKSLPPRNGE